MQSMGLVALPPAEGSARAEQVQQPRRKRVAAAPLPPGEPRRSSRAATSVCLPISGGALGLLSLAVGFGQCKCTAVAVAVPNKARECPDSAMPLLLGCFLHRLCACVTIQAGGKIWRVCSGGVASRRRRGCEAHQPVLAVWAGGGGRGGAAVAVAGCLLAGRGARSLVSYSCPPICHAPWLRLLTGTRCITA